MYYLFGYFPGACVDYLMMFYSWCSWYIPGSPYCSITNIPVRIKIGSNQAETCYEIMFLRISRAADRLPVQAE
jgi:hypothetical protein